MSDEIVILVENLGKRYQIQHRAERQRYTALRDVIAHKLKTPFQFLRRSQTSDLRPPTSARSSSEDFWALRDVSFEVRRGEVVGIIGRNGAGKSTLLKILSRITEPTEGRIRILGRVASLLEVGTGFHPELTGRENVFLNGAILGMHRAEIKRKFDEIVAFAEVEKFLDTPVKRYSSGMYVRLAFAVAAHLEPEILIVDEVLAVGDAQFQKKCLGKMQTVAAKDGRTVLFVSHHMPSIQRLCNRVILLAGGQIKLIGSTDQVVPSYLANAASVGSSVDLSSMPENKRRGNGVARFTRVELFSSDGRAVQEIRQGEPMVVRLHIEAKARIDQVLFGFSFVSADGTEIMGTTAHDGGIPNHLETGFHIFNCTITPMILCPGRYYIRAAIFRHSEAFDHIDEMIGFDVLNIAFDLSNTAANHLVGHVYLPFKWQNERTN
jgi:lipopolysaccharide transport system ATP-binding protein